MAFRLTEAILWSGLEWLEYLLNPITIWNLKVLYYNYNICGRLLQHTHVVDSSQILTIDVSQLFRKEEKWGNLLSIQWGGWGCEVSCCGYHRPRGKTTMGSALDGAVFDFAQILAYLVHNMSRSQLHLGFGHFADSLLFSVNNILAGLWLNCMSSVEITLFLLADILLQHRALFQC